jgi:hypothetical protein
VQVDLRIPGGLCYTFRYQGKPRYNEEQLDDEVDDSEELGYHSDVSTYLFCDHVVVVGGGGGFAVG